MTDRELLELAAKAAGIKWLPATTEKGIELEPKFGLWLVIDGEPNEYQRRRWNPITDDGDALRLAVKLMEFEPYKSKGYLPCILATAEETRSAIVRAAAEIGKAM